MASEKNRREEELGIDKVHSHLTKAGEKVANNKKGILIVIGIILVVAAFVLSYLFIYKNPYMNRAFEDYNAVAINSANDSIAAAQYMAVADQYNGEVAGNLAALSAGEVLYDRGEYELAAQYLKQFSSKDYLLESNALVLTGDCYVNLGDYPQALEYYHKAIRKAKGNPQIVPRVLLKEANIYDSMEDYQKALDCYMTIQQNYPQFQLGNNASLDAYIARENARLAN